MKVTQIKHACTVANTAGHTKKKLRFTRNAVRTSVAANLNSCQTMSQQEDQLTIDQQHDWSERQE